MSTRRGGKPPLGIKDTLAIAALQQKAAAAVTEAAEDCVALLRKRDLSQGWKPEEEKLTDDFQVLADLVNELLEQGIVRIARVRHPGNRGSPEVVET